MKNIIRFISLILACVLSAACLFAACSHGDGGTDGGNGTPPGENRPGEELPELPEGDGYPSELFSSGMYSPSKVGMSAEYLGTAERRLPEVSNGGEHVRGRKKQKYALHKRVRSLPDAFSRKRSVFLQKR